MRILETEFALAEHPLQYFDFVVCIANLPRRDEDVYALFEPQSIMRDGSLWSDASFASSSGFAAGMASGTKVCFCWNAVFFVLMFHKMC